MSYGVEFKNSDNVTVIDDSQIGYYVSDTGTISPDLSNYNSGVSTLKYAYFLDDTYMINNNQISSSSSWNSGTTYSVGNLVYVGSVPSSGSNLYECIKVNSNINPTASDIDGDGVNWVRRIIRSYNRVNSAIWSNNNIGTEHQSLLFFKLPNIGDEVARTEFHYQPSGTSYLERPVISSRSSLQYAVIKPLNLITTSISGYGMAIFNSSSELVYLSNEKLCNIDNMASNISENATISSSSSNVNWASITIPTKVNSSYNNSSTRFTQTIRRNGSTSWKNQIRTFSGLSYTAAPNTQGTFLIGRMD